MTTTIILVRHCVHDLLDRVLVGRAPNVSLSAAGITQAQCLAAALVRRGVTGVKSSPQMRARQTAEPVAALIGKPAEIMPEFDEADFGAWSGRAFDSLQNDCQWQRWNSDREACRPPGGETMRELQSRVLAGLSRLATADPGACIAVVTHAEPVRAAVLHYLGIPLGEFARVEIDPGSCTTIRFEPKPRIRGFRPLHKAIEIGNSRFRGGRGALVSGYTRAEAMMAALGLARTSARVPQTAAG